MDAPKTKIFVSYSRVDSAFADQLAAALDARGYGVSIDREDISDAEPWRERLEALILQADAVAFVMSPDSLGSRICDWETRRTVELGKRLIPLHFRAFDVEPPQQLSRLNYIPIDAAENFEGGVGRLCAACDVDIIWVREHTRLVNLATRWDVGGRKNDPLLRGAELSEAEAWSARRMPKAPEIPDVLLIFLQSSRNAETLALQREKQSKTRTQRLQFGVGGLTLLAIGVVIVGAIIVLELVSDYNKQRSNTLAELARVAADQGFYDRAARYALVGLQGAELPMIGVDASLAEAELAFAMERMGALGVMRGHDAPVSGVSFSPDGTRILSVAENGVAIIWDSRTGAEVARLRHRQQARVNDLQQQVAVSGERFYGRMSAGYSPNGAWIYTHVNNENTVRLWSAAGAAGPVLTHQGSYDIVSAAFNADGTRIVTVTPTLGITTNKAHVWDVQSGREIFTIDGGEDYMSSAAFSPDGARILTSGLLRLWDATDGRLIALMQPRAQPDLRYEFQFGRSVAFSPNGDFIVSRAVDGSARVWDGRTGQERRTLRNAGSIYTIDFDETSERILTAGRDGAVLWDARSGAAIAATATPSAYGAAISPRAGRMVTLNDAAVLFWNIADLQDQAIPPERDGEPYTLHQPVWFAGHESDVRSVDYSPDSERIVTGGEDGAVRLWTATAPVRTDRQRRWIRNPVPQTRYELMRQACETSLVMGLSYFTELELTAAPALSPTGDADACHPASPMARLRLLAPRAPSPAPTEQGGAPAQSN